jgi:diguanylate cyclase (GGDEF)-like protein
VHKRIGVEPKYYLSAVFALKAMLRETIGSILVDAAIRNTTLLALEKLVQIDVTFVFDTYVRSLLSEIEVSRNKAEQYGRDMERKVHERTLELQQIARSDPLTGLLNVRHLDEIVSRDLQAAQRRGEPICAVYIDVDNFKDVNDTQGHQQGDEVLRYIGSTIKQMTRGEDSCFRYGGDEFCVFLINCSAVNAQATFVHTLNEKIKQYATSFTVSCGVAQSGPTEHLSVRELVRLADTNMYSAKRAVPTRSH